MLFNCLCSYSSLSYASCVPLFVWTRFTSLSLPARNSAVSLLVLNCSSREFTLFMSISSHGLLIEYGRICHIVKLPVSMIRPFSLVNNLHITLYPQLELIWKVSKSLRKYWGKYGQIPYYKLYNARLYYS